MQANSLHRIEQQIQTTSCASYLAYSRPIFFHTDVRVRLLQRLRAIRLVVDLLRFPRIIKCLSSDRSWDNHWLVRVPHLRVPVIRTTRILTLLFAGYHPSESWPWTQIQTPITSACSLQRKPSLTVQPKQPIDTHIREMMLCNTIMSKILHHTNTLCHSCITPYV